MKVGLNYSYRRQKIETFYKNIKVENFVINSVLIFKRNFNKFNKPLSKPWHAATSVQLPPPEYRRYSTIWRHSTPVVKLRHELAPVLFWLPYFIRTVCWSILPFALSYSYCRSLTDTGILSKIQTAAYSTLLLYCVKHMNFIGWYHFDEFQRLVIRVTSIGQYLLQK